MSTDDGRTPVEPRIRIAIDGMGDPYLMIDVNTPTGHGFTADMFDQLALKMLAASAAARQRAAVVRDQLLSGASHEEALKFVNDTFGNP